jgi:periplasmic protein CpxP/Spy
MMQNSRYKVLLLLVGILLLTNGVLLLFFVGKKEPKEKQHTRRDRSAVMREFLKDSVGFNDQQLAQFDQVREQHQQNVRTLFEDMRKAKLSFYQLFNQGSSADSANQAAASVIAEKQKALDLAFFNHFREVRTLCQPEQLPRYDSLIQQIVRRMVSPPRRGDPKQKKDEQAVKK